MKRMRLVTLLGLMIALVGCGGDGGFRDLEAFIVEVNARPVSKIKPLPEFVPYETYHYQSANLRSPFVEPDLSDASADSGDAGNGISPNANRLREATELFPLDSLRMVGTLKRSGEIWVLITAPDDAIHRLREGNYLGQNHGRITHIGENGIEMTEIIPDGLGAWIESDTTMTLSD